MVDLKCRSPFVCGSDSARKLAVVSSVILVEIALNAEAVPRKAVHPNAPPKLVRNRSSTWPRSCFLFPPPLHCSFLPRKPHLFLHPLGALLQHHYLPGRPSEVPLKQRRTGFEGIFPLCWRYKTRDHYVRVHFSRTCLCLVFSGTQRQSASPGAPTSNRRLAEGFSAICSLRN